MSVTTVVIGIRPPDEEYHKMKAAWDACEAAGIDIPEPLYAYFDYQMPDGVGIRTEIPSKEWTNGDMCEGQEICLADIPDSITHIRVFQCY